MTSATLQRSPTLHGLSEARHVVVPAGIVSTSAPSIQATCAQLGLHFDPWQVGLVRLVKAKDSFGLHAAEIVVMSIPRQVGKTWIVGAVEFAEAIKIPGSTCIWTAHRFKVARETFDAMRATALLPALRAHVDPDDITSAAGNECIRFRNGSRIVFAARERGAIRGFTKVRKLILDEGQILTESAMADLAPTMNQAHDPQIVIMGTPPKPGDPGEVFARLRAEALAGESDNVLLVEFSAPSDCDPDDREAWRIANPSYPGRTSDRAMKRLRRLLTNADDWRREALGIWDENGWKAPIPLSKWLACAEPDAPAPSGTPVFALDVAPDRGSAAIAAAVTRADGLPQGEVVAHLPGTEWVVPRCVELRAAHPGAVFVVDPSGPAGSLIADLQAAGIEPVSTTARDRAQACGALHDATVQGTWRHLGQPPLEAALRGAVTRPLGDAWVWARKSSSSDICPLVAVTLAMWGLSTQPAIDLDSLIF